MDTYPLGSLALEEGSGCFMKRSRKLKMGFVIRECQIAAQRLIKRVRGKTRGRSK
jgi:hypothetical protein